MLFFLMLWMRPVHRAVFGVLEESSTPVEFLWAHTLRSRSKTDPAPQPLANRIRSLRDRAPVIWAFTHDFRPVAGSFASRQDSPRHPARRPTAKGTTNNDFIRRSGNAHLASCSSPDPIDHGTYRSIFVERPTEPKPTIDDQLSGFPMQTAEQNCVQFTWELKRMDPCLRLSIRYALMSIWPGVHASPATFIPPISPFLTSWQTAI